jgi:hypothetical protein
VSPANDDPSVLGSPLIPLNPSPGSPKGSGTESDLRFLALFAPPDPFRSPICPARAPWESHAGRLAPRPHIRYHGTMSRKKPPPDMIGPPPSARGGRPADPGLHAQQIAREWADVGRSYAERRMKELGIPKAKIGADDPRASKPWRAFDPDERTGGSVSTGIVIDSGVLNPELLKGKKGGRVWANETLRNRIDAIIAHEWAEHQTLDHDAALKAAAKTELPVGDGAKRILKAMAR